MDRYVERTADDTIVCRCERVTAGEIRKLIREGVRDINEIKAVTRAGMGSCGAKTCTPLIHRLFREEGVARRGDRRPAEAAALHGGPAGDLRRARRRRTKAMAATKSLRRHHHRRRERRARPTALFLAEAGPQGPRHRPIPERRPGLEQEGHRRPPGHPFRPGQDPPLPAQPRDLRDLERAPRRRHRVAQGRLRLCRLPAAKRSRRSRSSWSSRRRYGLNIDWLDAGDVPRRSSPTSTPTGSSAGPSRPTTATPLPCSPSTPSTAGRRLGARVPFRRDGRPASIIEGGRVARRANRQGRVRGAES